MYPGTSIPTYNDFMIEQELHQRLQYRPTSNDGEILLTKERMWERDFCVVFRLTLCHAFSIPPDDSSSIFSDGFRRIAGAFLARCKNNIADQRYKSKYFHESFMELISCKHSPSSSFNSLSLLSLQCDYFSCVWREKAKLTQRSPAGQWQNVETVTRGYFLSMGHLFCREQNMTIIDTVDLSSPPHLNSSGENSEMIAKGSQAMADMCAEGENLLQNPQIDRRCRSVRCYLVSITGESRL